MAGRETERAPEPPPCAIHWVRKRDGNVVAFDAGKLASSVLAACIRAGVRDPAFRAQELSQAVLHFLSEEFEGGIPATHEIGETVLKVLKGVGQSSTADAYAGYQAQRARLREGDGPTGLVVPPAGSGESPAAEPAGAARGWDKSRLVQRLEADAELDAALAREIAANVERQLLVLGSSPVTQGLVDELVDAALAERGLERMLARRRRLGVASSFLDELLTKGLSLDEICRRAGREIFRQYALREVFSPDVAALHEEGLLHLFGTEAPTQWGALAVEAAKLASGAGDFDAWLERLSRQLARTADVVEGAIALEGLDGVAALLAPDRPEPDKLAERVQAMLRPVALRRPLIVNLFGRVTDRAAGEVGEGPLFQARSDELEDRLAGTFALRLAEGLLADPELSNRVRIDFHPDLSMDDEDLERLLGPWARWARTHANVRIVYDRAGTPLGEGLFAGTSAGVIEYVGIALPELAARLGPSIDDETLLARIGILCEAAVRAGVQKREFLRIHASRAHAGPEPAEPVLVVVPIGLDELVLELIGRPISVDDAATSFAVQILSRIAHRLRREGRPYRLSSRIDGLPWTARAYEWGPRATGNTPGVLGGGPKQQLYAGGRLHAAVGAGTTFCRLADEFDPPLDEWVDLLHFAARQTMTCRLAFVRPEGPTQSSLDEDWIR